MAIRNLIANGIGFGPMAYVVTDGIGDFASTDADPSAWWVREWWRKIQERQAVAAVQSTLPITAVADVALPAMEFQGQAEFIHPEIVNNEMALFMEVLCEQ